MASPLDSLRKELRSLEAQRKPFDQIVNAVSETNPIINKALRKLNERIRDVVKQIEEADKQ